MILILIVNITPGFSGADLANLVNEATLFGARDRREVVSFPCLMKVFDSIIGGPETKSRAIVLSIS